MMPGFRDKIVSVDELLVRAHVWRASHERLVLANGCFDLLHVGHVRYLQAAAALAERLIVGVNGDAGTRQLKGPGRPILPEDARAQLVAALACVDAVVVFPELSVEPLLRRLRPDFHAKGSDYTAETVPEAAVARELGVEVRIAGDPKQHSTRDLIGKIRSRPG